VPAADVEDLYFDEPYYLAPQGRSGVKAYVLLRDALKDTGRLGVGTIVLRMREHLAAVEPTREVLVLSMMRFAHEIRSPKELEVPKEGEGWTKKEMALAHQLINTLADKWNPQEFRDTYTEVLRKVIEAKVEGKQVVLPEGPRRPRVANLMKALQASLKDGGVRKEPTRAAGRAKGPQRRRVGKRAA
jgi:DNA end-binding protein Ku